MKHFVQGCFVGLAIATAATMPVFGPVAWGEESGAAAGEESLPPRTLEVERLVLKDKNGVVRATLGVDEPGLCGAGLTCSPSGIVSLTLFDARGISRVVIVADEDRTYLGLGHSGRSLRLLSSEEALKNSYVPSFLEWRALFASAALNAGGGGLTDKISSEGIVVAPNPLAPMAHLKLRLLINTTTQPGWNYHLGKGKFSVSDREVRAAYAEAAEFVLRQVLPLFDNLVVEDQVEIWFTILGYEVGTWRDGAMTLVGEI